MAILENFPQALLDEHMAWHMNPPGTPGGRSKTNRGLDFLNFHRAFLGKVFAWFATQPAAYQAKYDLSPWTAIPTELKTDPATGFGPYAANEQRILTFDPPFSGENDFGFYIENTIHNNYLHGACAIHYGDPIIGSPMTSPPSTWFYKIHGLIEEWRQAFEAFNSIKLHDRNFLLAEQILFGLIDDGPGVLIGPDGPHPVNPGWGSILGATSHEGKQAVIQMAINRLASSLSPERQAIVMEPTGPGVGMDMPAVGHSWPKPEEAMPDR